MSSIMPYDKARRKILKSYLLELEEDAGGKDRLPHDKIIIKGKVQTIPVYKIECNDLYFNKSNGRIKSEVLKKEAELGRNLEVSDADDQSIIRDILLGIGIEENKKIKEDLRNNGQLRPGIITCDGLVINGNRRKALFEELYKERHNSKYKALEVQVLPSTMTKAELWLIEAGIQMSAPQQLDYSPINNLLKLREGIDSGLEIAYMATRIFGVSIDKIKKDLDHLELIDEFLKDFLDKGDRYYLVENLIEHFIDLHNIITRVGNRRKPNNANWEWDESDIIELKLVAFYYIRHKFAHLRIRDLQKLFINAETWQLVKRALHLEIKLSEEELIQFSPQAEIEFETDEEIEDNESIDVSAKPTIVEQRDKLEETLWRQKHDKALKEYFEDAMETAQIIQDSKQPLTLAKKALKNINAITDDSDQLNMKEIDNVLGEIIIRVNALRKITRMFRS
ncbi:MAG: hypothetical protein P9L92_12145 [Candidatus Electryonea clarkiae]|nr:hypothetical protein [Candidatus Electryonea clarkiae]MDP8287633.1 hypothetical protein [Candidatus Electryonea clarkiae]